MDESPQIVWVGPEGAHRLAPGAKLSIPFTVAKAGYLRFWVRARGQGPAVRIQARIDEGNRLPIFVPTDSTFHFCPGQEEETQSLQNISGKLFRKDGSLRLRAEGPSGAAITGASLAEGRAQATFRIVETTRATRGESPGAYFFLSESGLRTGLFAGIALAPGRFVIGSLRDGRVQILAQADGNVEMDKPLRLRLEMARGKLQLFEGKELRVASDVSETSRQFGWIAVNSEAALQDATLEEQERLLFASSFAQAGKTLPLDAGTHVVELQALEAGAEVDGVLFAESGALSQVPPQDLRRTRALYFDLTGRPPTEPEILAASRWEPRKLGKALLHSPEFWRRWFEEELYYFLLIDNFRPSGDLLRSVPSRLAAREIHVREALWQICICPEFNARNPGSDTFVTVVLEQLLGITVQKQTAVLEAGKKLYDGYPGKFLNKEGRSQSDVMKAIFDHPDFPEFYLDRVHRRLTGEALPAPLRKAAAEKFAAAPLIFPDLLEDWLHSPSYEKTSSRRRPKNDSVFLESIFRDFLHRPPTQQEHRNLFNALQALSDSGAIRMVLVKMILDSGKVELPEKSRIDFDPWLEHWFLRLLARTPTAKESLSFANLWKDNKCTPRLVLQALATHPEYQTY